MTAHTLRMQRMLWLLPRLCDVCGQRMTEGYAVKSDDGTEGDVCAACLGKEEE